MATFKSLSFPFALTIWVAFYSLQAAATALTLSGSEKFGHWQPITNLTDPSVVKIAKFAVAEHNKQPKATKLELVSLIKGYKQVFTRLDYHLIVSAKESGSKSTKSDKYLAMVYEKLGDRALKFISFNKYPMN